MQDIQNWWDWGDGILFSILFALLIIAAFWVAAWVLRHKVAPAILHRLDAEKHPVAQLLIGGFARPLAVLLKLLGICVALLCLCGWLSHEWLPAAVLNLTKVLPPIINKAIRVLIVLAVTWGLIASSDISSVLLRNARHRLDLHMSKSVSRFLSAVFNVVVVALAVVVLLSEFDYDINGLVAGLGLGGLTVALAAKDSASNFFGGLVLVTEKPFEIGDWISCDGTEGTVEDINLRSTKIRTGPGALTTVPNAVLSGAPITNWSGGMERRRADFTLQLVYGTAHGRITAFTGALRALLEGDPDIVSDSIIVRFSEIGSSGLDVRVIFYTSLPGFGDHLAIRERVNIQLLELAEAHGVELAYPTRTVVLQGADGEGA